MTPHLPAIRGIFDPRCQEFAVAYYGLTSAELSRCPPLDALDLPVRRDLRGASSTFAQLGFHIT